MKDGSTALCAFSDTRWTTKANNLDATLNTLPALIATLKELKSSDATCEGLLVRIGSFEFLLELLILKECFEFSRGSSKGGNGLGYSCGHSNFAYQYIFFLPKRGEINQICANC